MTQEQLHLLSLSLIPKVGPVVAKQLINHFGSATAIFNTPKGKLARLSGIGPKLSSAIYSQQVQSQRDAIVEQSLKNEINIHFYTEDAFPKRLKSVNDAPIVLYSKGNIEFNPKKTLGVVGTRRATRYGLKTTTSIVSEAKASHPTIISGLAFGIDVKGHEEALKNELSTIGVLACGLDQVYPSAHRNTAKKMLENGGLVSEYPIGIKADPRHFPARNRIIAALSDALIVVEAAKTGGALITANVSHSYDRPVFAVPGELGNKFSEGCNQLIRSMRASIYTSFDDVIREMNWDLAKESRQHELFTEMASLKGMEKRVMEVLMRNEQQLHIDELAFQTEFTQTDLAGLLLQLEFKGLVKPLPGKEYKVV